MAMRIVVSLSLVFCFGLVFATVPPAERQALVDFYTSLRGQDWAGKNNWLTGDPCENSWGGVTCNGFPNVVTLARQQQNLNGTIPDSIANLSQLEELFLSFNPFLVGTLPPFYVGLESFTSLTLEHNGFSGSIPPNLGQAPNLANLWLTENFTGTIPDDLFGAAPYQYLTITGALLEGTVPDSFCKSPPTLQSFSLSQTGLSGTFPDCLDNFPQLSTFNCYENSLSGTIPSSLSKVPLLYDLEMFDNKLTGSLPESFESTDLFAVVFSQNELVGTIPDYINNFGNASTSYLYLGSNQLTGTIPDWVCDVGVVKLQNNQFQCPEPSCCGTTSYSCGECQ